MFPENPFAAACAGLIIVLHVFHIGLHAPRGPTTLVIVDTTLVDNTLEWGVWGFALATAVCWYTAWSQFAALVIDWVNVHLLHRPPLVARPGVILETIAFRTFLAVLGIGGVLVVLATLCTVCDIVRDTPPATFIPTTLFRLEIGGQVFYNVLQHDSFVFLFKLFFVIATLAQQMPPRTPSATRSSTQSPPQSPGNPATSPATSPVTSPVTSPATSPVDCLDRPVSPPKADFASSWTRGSARGSARGSGPHFVLPVKAHRQCVLRAARLSNTATLPTRVPGGYDLYSDEIVHIKGNAGCVVNTNVVLQIPSGWYGRITEWPGLTTKNSTVIGKGVVDPHGPIKVCLFNQENSEHVVQRGDRIARIVFEKHATWPVEEAGPVREVVL